MSSRSFLSEQFAGRLDPAHTSRLQTLENNGQLLLGWPGKPHVFAASRITVWPRGVPPRRTVSLVSSRLGRRLDQLDEIFRIVRIAFVQLNPDTQAILAGHGSTLDDVTRRAARLFGLPIIECAAATGRETFPQWVDTVLQSDDSVDSMVWPCRVSPPVDDLDDPSAASGEPSAHPVADRVECLASDRVVALHVRPEGNVHRLLRRRLDEDRQHGRTGRVFVALGPQLVPMRVADELLGRGAIGWFLPSKSADPPPWCEINPLQPPARIIDLPHPSDWRMLTHCTRRTSGAWPDESPEAYLDALILGDPAKDRSGFAALIRILKSQTLFASNRAIRGGQHVVCFTAATPDELPGLRAFRPHRAQWDFEPYAIGLCRSRLQRLGARPVIYGDESRWAEIDPADQAFFQKQTTAAGIDWSREQEWRCTGDVDLSSFTPDEAIVLVSAHQEAVSIAQISPWPIAILPSQSG